MRRFSMSLISLALLAGCATTAATTPSLAGSEWRFATIDGAPPTGEATLAFRTDRLVANAGCNRMGGIWHSEGGKLIAGPLMSTRMFCEGRMEQERAVSELLGGSPEIAVNGRRMTLQGSSHAAELVRVR